MLAPKRTKCRKQQKGKMRGISKGATTLVLRRLRPAGARRAAVVTSRQIEAARMAITRHIKRGGKLYIRIFPDKPITKKPAETRMGNGKGSPEEWVAVVRPGRVMYELEGVDETLAREAFHLAEHKLPVQTRFVVAERGCYEGRAGEGPPRQRSRTSCAGTVRKLEEELFKHRLKKYTNQLENTMLIRNARREIARVKTVLGEQLRGGRLPKAPAAPAKRRRRARRQASAR